MVSELTFLEAIAHERDWRTASWEGLDPAQRRAVVLGAMRSIIQAGQEKRRYTGYVLASEIAAKLRIPGARRHGSGAKGGHSWTGYMSNALRVTPTLDSAIRAGMVRRMVEPYERTRYLYALTLTGERWLDSC